MSIHGLKQLINKTEVTVSVSQYKRKGTIDYYNSLKSTRITGISIKNTAQTSSTNGKK